MTGDPGYPERDTGERVSPEKEGLGAGHRAWRSFVAFT